MKKLLNIFSLLLLLPFTQSCFMEQEDLFENSAMERLEAKKVEAFDVLSSASNGWVMQYFVTGEDGYRGYALLVKFEKSGDDGVVQFAAKNAVTGNKYVITDGSDPNYPQSYFDVVFDNGPVLTFNSYNNLFHKFSDPNATGLPGDQGLGTGLGGDYEFVIIDLTPDKVTLKGKKRGTYTILTKLAEDVVWEDYFKELDAMNNRFYVNNPAPLRMVCGSKVMNLYDGSTSIFKVVDEGLDDLTYADTKKFIQTVAGLRFEVPFEYDGVSAGQDFYYNTEADRFESYVDGDPAKGILAYIDGGEPYDFYKKIIEPDQNGIVSSYWTLQETNMSDSFGKIFNAAKDAMKTVGFSSLKLFLTGSKSGIDMVQVQAKNLNKTNYWRELVRTEVGGQQFTYSYESNQSEGLAALFGVVPEMNELIECFSKTFEVQTNDAYNFTTLRLVATDDSDISFEVKFVKDENSSSGNIN